MFSLSAFRKSGGFVQLVQLIESADPVRQKALLNMVGTQDPGWAHLLKLKALTVEKIMKWPTNILADIFSNLSIEHLCSLYLHLPSEQQSILLSALPQQELRQLQHLTSKSEAKNADMAQAAAIALIKTVRELEAKGELDFENVDPILVIDQKLAA